MAMVFAYSASVQLNDPDWYLWFPLYACACAVNLVNWAITSETIIRQFAKLTLWVGVFLFIKVVIEGLGSGTAGLWCLDLSKRVVREKTGSGLVIISMFLHLNDPQNSRKRKKNKFPREYVEYGMAMLVFFTFGLPFVFFVVGNGEIKFDEKG
ncbi:uncharacterized protein [Euphorbia lathyris]|uniref:uncharacterized protein n=1 Tax=Euphorbia lathyris TaxID=212925 RepID=UPI0033144D27